MSTTDFEDEDIDIVYNEPMNRKRQEILKSAVEYFREARDVDIDPNDPRINHKDRFVPITEENLPFLLRPEFTKS